MNRTAEIAMIIATIIWGSSFVSGKMILDSTTPLYYLSIRFIGATILLSLVFHKHFKELNKSTLLAGLLIGVAVAIGYILQTVGLVYTTSSKAGFINGLFVVLVPVIDCVIRRSTPRVNEFLGVLLATIGLGVLSLDGSFGIGLGDTLVFLGAVSFAISIVLISRFARKYDPILLTVIQIAVTAVLSLFFATILEPSVALEVFDMNLILLFLYATVIGTAVTTVIQNWAQSKISATSTAIIFVLEPVVAGVFGFLLLHDPLGLKELLGSMLIIVGMLITLLVIPEKSSQKTLKTADAGL